MVDTRVIALALGIIGAVLGVVAFVAEAPVVGIATGLLALFAGVVAMWGSTAHAPSADADIAERDRSLEQTRHELEAARIEIEALRAERPATAASPVPLDAAPATDPSRTDLSTMDTPDSPITLPEPSTLTDADSQLFSEAYFLVALQSRLASARRHLRPVSVCLMEVTEGQSDAAGGAAPAGRVADAIRQTVREADIACRMDDGTFAVILEDTPENGAVWTVERTRRNLVSRFGTHTMWAGVACYPAHAFGGEELLEQAKVALRSAQEWNQDRIEVAAVES